MGKKFPHAGIIGQKGINLIERIVLEMGFVWRPTQLDVGIDGEIEIRDSTTGRMTNSITRVQSKATEKPFQAESATSFTFMCEERDLDYWINGNAPVILICSRPESGEAYWISIKDYFADTARRAARKIEFSKSGDRFDASCKDRLALLAIPRGSGVYLAPLPKNEFLTSNLLPVAYLPTHIYRASTDFRHRGPLFRALRDKTQSLPCDWVLDSDALISFHDLAAEPWTYVTKRGSSQRGDTIGWCRGPDATRHTLVQLLNRCLLEKLGRLDLRWSEEKECFFVAPTPNRTTRKFRRRTTFGPYMYKKSPDRVAYYRHSAFESQFYYFDGQWYLEISPTYYFTRDGCRLDSYYEERLTGIKRIENNSAVLGQLAMWADFLRQEQSKELFSQPYPFLKFGSLRKFEVGFGVFDDAWSGGQKEEEGADGNRLFAE